MGSSRINAVRQRIGVVGMPHGVGRGKDAEEFHMMSKDLGLKRKKKWDKSEQTEFESFQKLKELYKNQTPEEMVRSDNALDELEKYVKDEFATAPKVKGERITLDEATEYNKKLHLGKSARIQMARERLGAVGKTDWSKIISKQVKPKSYIPSIGAGFLGPKGEYFDLMEQADLYGGGHGRWLQDILKSTGDKSLMKKYDPELQESITPWLEDSGMIRLRHTDIDNIGIESHSAPTSAQIRSLKTYLGDNSIDSDSLAIDDYTNSGLESTLSGRNRFNAKLRQRIEVI